MFGRAIFHSIKDPVWQKVASFSLVYFFILLSDAILSFWIPNFLNDIFKNPLTIGIVMSFSSIAGFVADLLFPQALKGMSVGKLTYWTILVSFLFIILMAIGVKFPIIIIILLGMTLWGIYYEYSRFASQQFVADSVPLKLHSSGWGIIDTFRNLAYFIGPILAGLLLLRGEFYIIFASLVILLIAALIYSVSNKSQNRVLDVKPEDVSILRELRYWKSLTSRVWPIVILSLFMGILDAAFWTTGAIWSESLSDNNFFSSLILPAYELPALFIGLILARFGIYKGKKKISEIFFLLSGCALLLLGFNPPPVLYPLIILLTGFFLSFVYPLNEAVYSDVTARMGTERKHMVGLASSTTSLAYIIGPTISGFIANNVGERQTFVIFGFIVLAVSLVLLASTPKKIHLPQAEISNWKD